MRLFFGSSQLGSRTQRKYIRSNYITPTKDWLHQKRNKTNIAIKRFSDSFFKLKNLRYMALMIASFWIFKDFAFASANGSTAGGTGTGTDGQQFIFDMANFAISIGIFITTPLIMLAGWLLSPDWTFGEVFGLREIFHNLWILVSNVVYFVFAFILIYIAFLNIFSEGQKNYQIKTALPRLVVSILIVPISWFVVSQTLSISNVLTAAVIRLPADMIGTLSSPSMAKVNTFFTEPTIPRQIVYDRTFDYGTGVVDSEGSPGDKSFKGYGNFYTSNCDSANSDSKSDCVSIEKLLTDSKGGAFGILTYYAYGVFKIQDAKTVDSSEKNSNKDILDFAVKLGFSAIFLIIFGLLLIAIVIALFSRISMLWMYAIFSPLFALSHFFKGAGGKIEEQLKKHMTIQKFISLALVPVYVSATLSFGILFLAAVQSTGINASNKIESENVTIEDTSTTDSSEQTFTFGKGDSSISLTTIGLLSKKTQDTAVNAMGAGKGILGSIIINFLAIGVLWMVVMAALNADDLTKNAVKPFEDMGNAVGKFISESPKHVPIPVGRGPDGKIKFADPTALSKIANMPSQALELKSSNQAAPFQKSINQMMRVSGLSPDEKSKLAGRIAAATTGATLLEIADIIKSNAGQFGRNDPAVKALEAEFLQKLDSNEGLKRDYFSKIGVASPSGKLYDNGNVTDVGFKALVKSSEDSKISQYKNALYGSTDLTKDKDKDVKSNTVTSSLPKEGKDDKGTLTLKREGVGEVNIVIKGKKIDYDSEKADLVRMYSGIYSKEDFNRKEVKDALIDELQKHTGGIVSKEDITVLVDKMATEDNFFKKPADGAGKTS